MQRTQGEPPCLPASSASLCEIAIYGVATIGPPPPDQCPVRATAEDIPVDDVSVVGVAVPGVVVAGGVAVPAGVAGTGTPLVHWFSFVYGLAPAGSGGGSLEWVLMGGPW